jgi:hypothetical protein
VRWSECRVERWAVVSAALCNTRQSDSLARLAHTMR